MISARSLALGASTPWKRIRCTRGRGTSAARRFRGSAAGEAGRETLHPWLREVLGETPELRFYRLCERCRADSWGLDGEPLAVFPRTIIL